MILETEKIRTTALEALDAAKREARRVAKGLRAAAGRNSPRAGDRLAARLLETFDTPAGTGVSAFWPLDSEIDTRPAMTGLHERGCQVALPVMRGPGMALQFRRWQPGDELTPAAFGTREPGADKLAVTPTVLLVPLLAFDRAGYRLGYGGGFYDRTLAELRGRGAVCAIGLAYAGQEMASVPHDDNDQPLDWIMTEEETIRIERG